MWKERDARSLDATVTHRSTPGDFYHENKTNLSPDVLVTRWTDEGETDQEHVGLGV